MALTEAEILALITSPRRVQGDEGSVEMRSADEIAKLLKLAESATTNPTSVAGFGLRRMRAKLPSALGD